MSLWQPLPRRIGPNNLFMEPPMDLGDIGTGLAVLGASQVAKDAVARMLAPTADYVGAGLLSSAKAGANLAGVLVRAVAKRGGRFEDGGKIPPRVLKGILDDAPFCEDEVTAEYLGGVLASSWSRQRRDDRAVAHIATIRRLSTYSLRMHCVLYQAYAALYFEGRIPQAATVVIHVPESYFMELMGFAEDESVGDAWAHSIIALEREALADVPFAGSPRFYRDEYLGDGPREVVDLLKAEGGVMFRPTASGTELFLAGCGFAGYGLFQLPKGAWDRGELAIENLFVATDRCRTVDVDLGEPRFR
jgi:hypothetical protein